MLKMLKIKNPALYLVFLSMLGATPPLATDMYLASIPKIASDWNVHVSVVNLSLVLWFTSFSISLLIFGPLSDKYGRRPVLLFGLATFVVSSFFCGMSTGPVMLIVMRIIQGMGAAAPSSMVMAICRDRFDGVQRQKALAYIGVIMAVAPMVAPSIGSFLLSLGSWRFVFFTQGAMVLITFIIALGYEETAKELNPNGVMSAFLRYFALAKNREYAVSTTVMGLASAPFYGFIAFSPIVYMKIFNLPPSMFGFMFGANAVFAMMGSFSSAKLASRIPQHIILTAAFTGAFIAGLTVLLFGKTGYIHFAFSMFAFSFFLGLNRPVSASLVLEQVKTDIGSASSFMVFYQFITGAICMWYVTIPWEDPLRMYGYVVTIVPFMVLVFWPVLYLWLRRLHRI